MQKQRGYKTKKKKPKGGRNSLSDGSYIVMVGIKMPSELEDAFIEKTKELGELGFGKVDKSELIRTLAEYMLDYAVDVYQEREQIHEPNINDAEGTTQT
jgi:hypothetical protein